MSRRALHLLFAIGLALSVFAGLSLTASAQEPTEMYFPWVPNGAEIDDPRNFGETGPYDGTITIQNLEDHEINVAWNATETADSGTVSLDPFASTTLTASELFSDDNDVDGSGVIVTGEDGARIAAVEKQASPQSPDGDARTGSDHNIVAGYTGLTGNQIGENLVLPIVQTNNNWNTLIRLTNFGESTAAVDVTLHEAGGDSEPMEHNLEIRAGATLTFDLLDRGVPDDWTGSARIEADEVVGAVAERVKNETNMLIMNTSEPADDGQTQYAPLVFQEWFNWNTGISIANLAEFSNDITITYYDDEGQQADQETITVPPNGMDFVYTPATVADNDNGEEGFVGSAEITGEYPFRGSVDEVKYFGDRPDVNHAMSYMIEDDAIEQEESLALPLVQKGDSDTAFGDTTGIQLFNPSSDESATVAIWFIDEDGQEALALPQVVALGPREGHTAYTFDFAELPVDFQGSAIIRVIRGNGEVTAASNNVNYEVQFDGSASFNLVQSGNAGPPTPDVPLPPPASFTVEPESEINELGDSHSIAVTVLDEDGDEVEGASVAGVILDGPHEDHDVLRAETDANGEATLQYSGSAAGTDEIMIHVQGIAEVQYATKTWAEESAEVTVNASDLDGASEDEQGDIVADAFNPSEAAGGEVEEPVRFRITVDGPQACTDDSWETWFEIDQVDDGATEGINDTFNCDNGVFVGFWGDDLGLTLPPEYDVDTTFTVSVNQAPVGEYTVTVELFNLDTDEIVAESSDQFEITSGDG